VKIGDRETQIVVAPDQIPVFKPVAAEKFLGQKRPDPGMLRIMQKRTEVDDLLGGIIELQSQAVSAHVLGMRNTDDGWIHESSLVIFSAETDLWRTK